MRIKGLYGRHRGEDVWVVGTGASMRVFPLAALAGRTTIGLNQAHKYGPMTYSITVHPELVQEYESIGRPTPTQWIVKRKPPMADLSLDDPRYYVFETDPGRHQITGFEGDKLYLAHGIHHTAMSLAAKMGARAIFLVGCDMTSLDGEHHGHDQHVRFHGMKPRDVYHEYQAEAAVTRRYIREALDIPIVSVTPFLGLADIEEDYRTLKRELQLAPLPPPPDTSGYIRKKK